MKQNLLRRLGALTLALALALSLSVVPAMAAGTSPTVNITGDRQLTVGKGDGTLTASLSDDSISPTGYSWSVSSGAAYVGIENADQAAVTVTPKMKGEAVLTVTVSYEVEDTSEEGNETGDKNGATRATKTEKVTGTVTVTIGTEPLRDFTLDPEKMELNINDTKQISIKPDPEIAVVEADKVTWSSNNTDVATVDANGKVTGRAAGAATITVTTQIKDNDGYRDYSQNCEVTVKPGSLAITSIAFSPNSKIINPGTTNPVNPTISPSSATETVRWESSDPSVVRAEVTAGSRNGWSGSLIGLKPGEAEITAYAVDASGNDTGVKGILKVEVTGIVINPETVTLIDGTGRQTTIVCQSFGTARTNTSTVRWSSGNPSVVSVDTPTGNSCLIHPVSVGTTTITATKGTYTATCTVTVQPDYSSIAGPYAASSGQAMQMSQVFSELDRICRNKTAVTDAYGNVTAGQGLSYITNLSVSPNQGVLYYNYNSAANTGDGVGQLDKFSQYSDPYKGIKGLSSLSFVPNKSFSGTAEIQYAGWSTGNENFSGVIQVNVNGMGASGDIFYDTISGQPADFLAEDFNAFCRNRNGRDLSYVTFTLPSASLGTLYYNYTGQSANSSRVTASTRYNRSGSSSINGVSFVPAFGTSGTVTISYRAYDTAGASYTGYVRVNVSASTAGSASDVYIAAEKGQRAAFTANLFNDACRYTLGESLSYVRFTLPAASEGTLYYNYRSSGSYDGRVDTASRYYYSGTPGISNITFVPAANAPAQVSIPYTGYGVSGSTYTGTIRIGMASANQGTINYSVPKNGQAAFVVSDFNNVCLTQTGNSMDYVYFSTLPSASLGVLYYNYRSNLSYNTRVTANTQYYRSPRYSYQNQLGYISFVGGNTAGTVTIPFYGYSTNNVRFEGSVVIQTGSTTPVDINLSGNTASQIWLPSSSIRSACNAVMNSELSYIELTSLPGEKEGRVYRSYSSLTNKVEAKTGERYYRAGSPSIDQLSFIPYGGFNGTAVVTYVGYSSNGVEQVSGQIKITITTSTTSRYFNDMSRHTWAADAVDFLYANNISNGIGGGRFGPSSSMARGDFVLMLVRTFGLTSSGTFRYSDVPANSYYASAISTARQLGIISGSGNFYPKQAITRQDAMVMLYNALTVSGKNLTNGLAADLTGFSDRDSIANYARNAVGALVQMGVVKGDGNGRLRPTGTLTRAETAILLQYVLTL